MTDTTRNVELVIRAKNLSKKTLDDVRKEIDGINKALDEQVDASKRGEGSLKDLNAAYGRLEGAMKSLLQQESLVKNFEAQQQQLVKLEAALAGASAKLLDHQKVIAGSEKVTKRQVQQQDSYQKAVERSQAALDKQAQRLAATKAEGEALGLAMGDLAQAQNQILNTAGKLSQAYDKQSAAVRDFRSNVDAAARSQKAAADTELFQKQAAEAARLVKASEYINFWTNELEKMEATERRLASQAAADSAFDKQAREAAKLVKASDYVNFWTDSLERLERAERQAENGRALKQMADDAMAAARGYTTLGDSTQRLVQNNRALSQSMRQILDPSAQARSTLSGVEEEVNALSKSISAIRGPVTDYKAQMRQLADANKALTEQASGVESYQRQISALRDSRAEFVKNRAEMLRYVEAMRAQDQPTTEMQQNLKRLEQNLASSAGAFQKQVAQTRAMRQSLRDAGVDTNNLNGAVQRLTATARNSVSAMESLGGAVERYGHASRNAGEELSAFESNGRTTLSLMQRIRGEVLALAAAYVGLQGTIGLANDSLSASNTKEGIQNQLAISVGDDPKAIAAEYEYIREQADRIGVSFEQAAKGYARFSAAASLAGRGSEEIRYVAESFLEVGRVANLSADDIDGVFKALEQIYSKGKIQAEELRGQLGDRLFGAFEIAAKALEDQWPNLDKAMENGEITSDQLLAIAEEYRKTVAERLPTAMENLASNQQRLNSAFFDFKVLIADSGFADQYSQLVNQITAFLTSEDGANFAKGIGEAFGSVVTVLSFLIEHLDEVQLALELAFGIKALSLVAGLAATITTRVIPALIAMQAQLVATGVAGATAMTRIRLAFLALTALFAGWMIGTYVSEKFEIVRQLGVSLVIGLIKGFTQMKYGAEQAFIAIPGFAKKVFNEALNHLTDFVDSSLGLLATLAESVGLDSFAETITGFVSDGVRRETKSTEVELAKLRKAFEAEMDQIDEIGFSMFQDASDASRAGAAPGAPAGPTEKPTIVPGAKADDGKAQKEYEKLVKKRIQLADELVRALEAAEGKIQRNEKLSLEQRLAAIDTEYAKVYRKIDQLSKLPGGKEQAEQMRTQLSLYVDQLKEQEKLKFAQEDAARRAKELARLEKQVNDIIALRTQLLQNVETQRQVGGITDMQAKEQVAGIDASYTPQINEASAALLAFGQANKDLFADQTALDLWVAKVSAIPNSIKPITNALYTTQQANEDLASGMTGAFDSFAQSIANGENAIRSFKDAFLQFAADFLKKIAMMIIQQAIFNALQNSNIGGMIAGGVSGVAQKHSGGLVGSGSNGVKRSAPSSWFANAPEYHTGGVVGLAPDEYPAILKRNEEVLTDEDPRNVLNGGAAQGGGAQPVPQDLTVNNYVDAESFMGAALAKQSGQKMIMNVLSANRTQIKQLIG